MWELTLNIKPRITGLFILFASFGYDYIVNFGLKKKSIITCFVK